MARVTYSPLISDIRGKTADAVFSSWKGRSYIRQRVDPANPNTSAQQAVRNAMAAAVGLWQGLSNDLKSAYGRGGAALGISGYNDFCKRNRAPIQAESGLWGPRRDPAAAAPRLSVPQDVAYGAEPLATSFTITWTDSGNGAGHYMGILAYDLDAGELHVESLTDTLESAATITVADVTAGNTYLVAAFIVRDADDDMLHAGTVAHTQTA